MADRKPIKNSPKKKFCKVLNREVSEFSQHLRIPPAFVKNFDGKSLCKFSLRGPCGTWDVELERRENGLFFHDHGWQGFVKDHVLEKGDFLVFSYDRESNFDVTVYDRTCCEKDVEAAKKRTIGSFVSLMNKGIQARDSETESNNQDSENETTIVDKTSRDQVALEERGPKGYVEETSTGVMVFKSENSCFIETFRKQIKYRMMIPKGIAVAEGYMGKISTVLLEDPFGRSWPVKLRSGGQSDLNRLLMTKGWTKCHKANKISLEDTLIFECVKQGVIQIHIFKAGDKRCPVELVAS